MWHGSFNIFLRESHMFSSGFYSAAARGQRQKSSMSKLLLQFLPRGSKLWWHEDMGGKLPKMFHLCRFSCTLSHTVHIPVNHKIQKHFGHTRLLPRGLFLPFSTGLLHVYGNYQLLHSYTVKSDTLKLVDLSMSNCTSSWQLLGVRWKSDFSHYSK